MKKKIVRDAEASIDTIASAFFEVIDHVRAARCPICLLSGSLVFTPESGHLRITCLTPYPLDSNGEDQCSYNHVIYGTVVADLPQPRFTVSEPPPGRIPRRRSTS